jgi:hypothetical protein
VYCIASRTSVDCPVDSWRRTRRAAHEGLRKNAARSYHTLLLKEGVLLASALLLSPRAQDLEKHFQRTAASATMSMLYDYPTLETENDKTLSEIHAFIDRLSVAAVPGTYLVDLFPWMMHIPERFALVSMTVFLSLSFMVLSDLQGGKLKGGDFSSATISCSRHSLIVFGMTW